MPSMRDGQAPATAIYRADYQAPAWWIDSVELTFDLDPAKTRVLNKMHVRRNPDVAAQPLRLHGEALTLLRVQADASLVEVRGVSTDSLAPAPVFHATWRFLTNTADPAFGFAPTDRDAAGQLHLDRLVEAGIGAFLDQHVRFTRTGVSADLPPALIADRIEAMARTACSQRGSAVSGGSGPRCASTCARSSPRRYSMAM